MIHSPKCCQPVHDRPPCQPPEFVRILRAGTGSASLTSGSPEPGPRPLESSGPRPCFQMSGEEVLSCLDGMSEVGRWRNRSERSEGQGSAHPVCLVGSLGLSAPLRPAPRRPAESTRDRGEDCEEAVSTRVPGGQRAGGPAGARAGFTVLGLAGTGFPWSLGPRRPAPQRLSAGPAHCGGGGGGVGGGVRYGAGCPDPGKAPLGWLQA